MKKTHNHGKTPSFFSTQPNAKVKTQKGVSGVAKTNQPTHSHLCPSYTHTHTLTHTFVKGKYLLFLAPNQSEMTHCKRCFWRGLKHTYANPICFSHWHIETHIITGKHLLFFSTQPIERSILKKAFLAWLKHTNPHIDIFFYLCYTDVHMHICQREIPSFFSTQPIWDDTYQTVFLAWTKTHLRKPPSHLHIDTLTHTHWYNHISHISHIHIFHIFACQYFSTMHFQFKTQDARPGLNS